MCRLARLDHEMYKTLRLSPWLAVHQLKVMREIILPLESHIAELAVQGQR
jgi:hypothetical protein